MWSCFSKWTSSFCALACLGVDPSRLGLGASAEPLPVATIIGESFTSGTIAAKCLDGTTLFVSIVEADFTGLI